LIYDTGERFVEGETLAVRAPKDSGDEFWLCALDGVGTEDNKEGLEITWYESKGTGIYLEGEEDDITVDSVICKTRLNVSKDGTWVLPPVELKAIRDSLKLEREESSEIVLSEEKSDDASLKEDGELPSSPTTRSKREPRVYKTEEKPKRERKQPEKRKVDESPEPKPKRKYNKKAKPGTEVVAASTQEAGEHESLVTDQPVSIPVEAAEPQPQPQEVQQLVQHPVLQLEQPVQQPQSAEVPSGTADVEMAK